MKHLNKPVTIEVIRKVMICDVEKVSRRSGCIAEFYLTFQIQIITMLFKSLLLQMWSTNQSIHIAGSSLEMNLRPPPRPAKLDPAFSQAPQGICVYVGI